jgi:multidrug transporter EmrE-like cation transporter
VCVVAIGIATFFMWSFNLFAYQDGAYISLKKLVMNASYMFMIFLVGTVFFAETVTLTKILGFLLYVVAITLMDNKLFGTVSAIFHRGLAAAR